MNSLNFTISPLWSITFVVLSILLLVHPSYGSSLTSSFYEKTCPNALKTIQQAIQKAVSNESRMAASLIRLHFHDCFVQGCDASILLDAQATSTSERNAFQNIGSLRGYEVVDSVKVEVEKLCPGIVSCADILAVTARDASVIAGGPSWTVMLGRRDSTTANRTLAESDLPLSTSTLDEQISIFSNKGLNTREMVALTGSHTLGQAQCSHYRERIYNGTQIDATFAQNLQKNCTRSGQNDSSNLAPFDLVTPNSFDNNYFKNLLVKKGLLPSDQILFSGGATDNIVVEYSKDASKFNTDFADAMVKMGNISPLTGSEGVIRKICSKNN
ncbi:lignin-forming anionic peroxidase-like [Impatiens glandulifera]|uniref:lignin-forming anionic peroxidase-like n=1 Tax=Impatiens glandulifera TaxID=253017 RepID=UPI001FB11F7A|nr:lignin-forming anionic peroxidase-like [Impatiens glandulifera]